MFTYFPRRWVRIYGYLALTFDLYTLWWWCWCCNWLWPNLMSCFQSCACVCIPVLFNHIGAFQMNMSPVCIWPLLRPTWQSFLTSRPSTWASTRTAPSNLIITGRLIITGTLCTSEAVHWLSSISYVLPQRISVVASRGQTNLQMRTSRTSVHFWFPRDVIIRHRPNGTIGQT